MTFLSLISRISFQKKKKKKIRNINLETHQFSCEVTAGINTLKKYGIYTAFWSAGYSESCFANVVKFVTVVILTCRFLFRTVGNTVVTLALVSVFLCVIGVGTQLGVSIK